MNQITHLAIIMDGNQRWAKKNNLLCKKVIKSLDKLIELIKYCIKKNIPNLTVYALSTENIKRKSINLIYSLIDNEYKKIITELSKTKSVTLKIFGEKKNLPDKLINTLSKTQISNNLTSNINVNVAFNYGSDKELVEIIKNINNDNIYSKEINSKLIRKYRYLGDIPDPDILIRTGGHRRLSNFILLYLSLYRIILS